MSWERDYMNSSRPFTTGFNGFAGLRGEYEYGLFDEENNISFADALRRSQDMGGQALRLVEGAEIHDTSISFARLQNLGVLNYAVELPFEQLSFEGMDPYAANYIRGIERPMELAYRQCL